MWVTLTPLVVPEFSPKGLITITYDGKDTEVALGNLLKPSETQNRPEISLTISEKEDNSEKATYTLVLTDPDAPTKGDKKWSEYCHYVVSGIKPSETTDYTLIDFSQANELIPYMGPAPPVATGKHRYIFVLYKENPSHPPKIFESTNRANWGTGVPGSGTTDWATKNKLTPVAINFFYAQNPDQGDK